MDYVVIRPYEPEDELYHYGVLGMKWGVRRATKQLSRAKTKEQRDKATSKLKKHREKSSAKIEKLQKKSDKLHDKYDVKIEKQRMKAARYTAKSARLESRANAWLTSQARAEKLLAEARKQDVKAKELTARADEAKARIDRNDKMLRAFQRGVDKIDAALVEKGRRSMNG